MAFSTTVNVRDTATPQLAALLDAADHTKVGPVIGRAGVNKLREHFFGLDRSRANKLGGKRTHFYSDAARSTNFLVATEQVTLSINKQGIRQRVEGGTILPRKSKMLTIPAIAEAYGKRAREFSNLRFAKLGDQAALVEAEATQVSFGKRGAKGRGSVGGKVFFWLVPSVTQDPDPSVMPTKAELLKAITDTLDSYFARARQRGGNGAAGGAQ